MALRTVRLYGVLRAHFGRDFKLDVASPSEAVQALCCLLPGFEQFLRTAEQRGLAFKVFKGKRNLIPEEMILQGEDDEIIRISPVIMGSKSSGVFQVVLGVALIAVSIFVPGLGTAVATGLLAAGAGIAVGGVVQMLSPVPKPGEVAEQDGNNPGSGFGGPITTTAQGHPVPLLYGEREIGGAVASGGFYPEDAM